MRGFIPKTQLFGATADALNYKTISRVMATVAARWLKIPRTVTTESMIQEALKASTVLNQIFGFDLKEGKSEWGIGIEFLGGAVAFLAIRDKCEAQLSLSRERIQKVS